MFGLDAKGAVLRVGIIGLGVGEKHIAGYSRHAGCQVVALCDFDTKTLAAVGDRYPSCARVPDADTLISDPEIDLLSIASFDNYHCEQVVQALDNGKHVFVEKPLCLSEAETIRIREALQRNPRCRLSSNFPLRKVPRFIELKQWLQDGRLGELYMLEGDYHYGRFHKLTHGWRGKIPFYSVIFGGAIHLVDLLWWLTGEEVEEVTAVATNIASRGTQFRYNDTAAALLRFKSGVIGRIGANFSCVYPHTHMLSIYGTKATYINNATGALLFESRDSGVPPQVVDSDYTEGEKGSLIYSFVESVIRGGAPEISTEDVFRSMSICLAIEQSVAENRLVKVRYI